MIRLLTREELVKQVDKLEKQLAARDKWWIEQIEAMSTRMNTNMYGISLSKEQWQSLKQSLEAK
jgi:hypothetical protein